MKHPSDIIKSWLLVPGSWLLVLGSLFLIGCRPDTTCRLNNMANQLQLYTADTLQHQKTLLLDLATDRKEMQQDLIRPTDSVSTILHIGYHAADTQFVSLACGCRIAYKLDTIWVEDDEVASAVIIDYDIPSFDSKGKQTNNIEVIYR